MAGFDVHRPCMMGGSARYRVDGTWKNEFSNPAKDPGEGGVLDRSNYS